MSETDPPGEASSQTETDLPAGQSHRSSPTALVRADVVSTAPLRANTRLLDLVSIRTPALDSGAGSALDSVVDSWTDSMTDSAVADPSRPSDTAGVVRHDRDTR